MRTISYLISFLLLAACTGTPLKKHHSPCGTTSLPKTGTRHSHRERPCGTMVFGGVEKEQLQLNENTLYSGEPSVVFKDVKITPEMFDKVVGLMKAGKYKTASDLVCKNWLGRLHQYYQPFGDLHIQNNKPGDAAGYKRALNISDAVATTVYKQNGVKYEQGSIRFPSGQRDRHASEKRYTEWHRHLARFTSPHPTALQKGTDDRLILHGQAPGYVERRTFEQIEQWGDQYKHPELYDANGKRKFDKRMLYGDEIGGKGMFFEAQLKPVFPKDGNVRLPTLVSIYTTRTKSISYSVWQQVSMVSTKVRAGMVSILRPKQPALRKKALSYDYQTLKQRHTEDYRSLFDRVDFELFSSPEQKAMPTDKRLEQFAGNADPRLGSSPVPVRPLPDDQRITSRRTTFEPARNAEQRHNSSLELRLYDQYQYRNELLASRTHQSVGMPGTSFPNDPGTVCLRCRNSPEYV